MCAIASDAAAASASAIDLEATDDDDASKCTPADHRQMSDAEKHGRERIGAETDVFTLFFLRHGTSIALRFDPNFCLLCVAKMQ